MDKHIEILTKLLIYWWEYNRGVDKWNNLHKNNKESAIDIFIYSKLRESNG